MTSLVEVCEQAARMAGQVLLDWADRFEVREKGPSDLVTQADIEAQSVIRRYVSDRFPNHGFLGEEDSPTPTEITSALDSGEFVWLVDPLDGTTNYAHQVPHYCVSVAVANQNQVAAGCIYSPRTDECFRAAVGEGAFLNEQRIQTSEVDRLEQSLVAISFPPRLTKESEEFDDLLRLFNNSHAVRRMGSAALNLCYVASGRFDAYWATKTKIWDVAAGLLIVREAGGTVSALDGREFRLDNPRPAATATPNLNRQLVQLLRPAN